MTPTTVIGTVTGTGAIINVIIGFKPDRVVLINRTSGASLEWFRAAGIAGGSRKVIAAGTVTMVTGAASVVDYASAVPTGGDGFTIPVDAQVNVNTQIIDYVAYRSGAGAR